ncbi:DUF2147 domain-containing protein [Tropicimonas isoalkanivorans]|uniref:DUF2147 domain-containing protein n=1 Tax=Tropicimonas isoalkanivorans TaxID=441112 RepID=A0A1I1R8G7_9RHOB|nr:DUF2147 domain-containing protein [Tropicimonas isoalkanivorans]SFD27843.1 hypothetical protein SAMN04488094_1267 [Tropicimonas isoalkanivorans]
MKPIVPLALGLFLAAAPAFAGDPVVGTWKTQPDDNGHFGLVAIAPCGDRICGKLTRAFGEKGKPVASDTVGRQIVWNMRPEGAGKYEGGRIWAPDRDKTYNGRMELSGARLKVSGCVLGLCRGQTWTRAN